MIQNTFCHLAGIGALSERRIWDLGIHHWTDLEASTDTDGGCLGLSEKKRERLRSLLADSHRAYQDQDPGYFAGLLPSNQQWRLFKDFRESIAYLDIETTGLESTYDSITTIALYDGRGVYTYVQDRNMEDFGRDIQKYKMIVTYNGKTFDVPFIRSHLGVKMDQAHLDLRYALKSIGYSGGLKQCERALGFDRGKLKDVDGYMAVLLWHEFRKTGRESVLDTLLAYNIEDVLSLEALATFVYNTKLKETPFHDRHRLETPQAPPNPFQPDDGVLDRLREKLVFMQY